MKYFYACLLSLLLSFSSFSTNQLIPGNWNGALLLNVSIELPVFLSIDEKEKLSIHNDEETIILKKENNISDSTDYIFPDFNSFIRVSYSSQEEMTGYWYNKSKGDNYKIPFHATFGRKELDKNNKNDLFTGKWTTIFDPKNDPEIALGIFKQKGEYLSGTFLTETGDYRFLAGENDGKNFTLSCFDGSHAFLFKGSLSSNNDSLIGQFYSGIHGQSEWIASRNLENPDAVLRNPDSITYVVDNKPIVFNLNDIDGKEYQYPNSETKDKVVIIQIMGTWCPNCLDETKFFKQLYEKYHKEGLEIISIGYETSKTDEGKIAAIRNLKERHNLDYTFLIGGYSDKNIADKTFNMLNEIVSFPTTIFIDRTGKVALIHTGFAGPGTGKYYTDYTKKTEDLIQELLK